MKRPSGNRGRLINHRRMAGPRKLTIRLSSLRLCHLREPPRDCAVRRGREVVHATSLAA